MPALLFLPKQLYEQLFIFICRIHELQEDIIKVKLDLENAQDYIKHLNTQVRSKWTGSI